jgi:hypothetical protein
MSFISLSPKGLEDSLACGCGMTDSVKYLLKNVFFGKKIDLSLKKGTEKPLLKSC